MTAQHNNIILDFALVFFCIAAIFNPTLPAGTPWYGRFHFGWAACALAVASIVF
jgi:hypothetical protein